MCFNCKRIPEQIKTTFLHIKVSKSAGKLSTEYTEFLSKLCTWEHSGRDLPVHRLAAGKTEQVSL